MADVNLRDITKRFGKVVAADNVTLTISSGELFTLLGPSGCGKTTILRIIAGLEVPDNGRVLIAGEDVTDKRPYERGTAMVFQNYALWPHMTVFENVAFGLKVKKLPRNEVRKRVKRVLELVKLEGLEDRYPTQLSGGQQQRVALARALVVEPKVLLLDEPLSNLDAKLRIEMREELKKLQKELGITTIYVTHDQEEAMTISDRVAVMRTGRVLQVGTPTEVYRNPNSLFVASFVGRSSVIRAIAEEVKNGEAVARVGAVKLRGSIPKGVKVKEGDVVAAVMRPEDFTPTPSSSANLIEGTVEVLMFLGSHFHARINLAGEKVLVKLDPDIAVSAGSKLRAYIDPSHVLVLPWEEFT